ncbi:restriction endonuclease [Defluviimonas sp. D31]|uniref:restriction endonuclease n=1 Tax=Defluviimonas sp. D31 TaxID=3083253 RepID=UPI00296EC06C|nr:restriction endonuclease [Defluviimonas sp. D31]MDW4548260.1 restriction endonuclease [Defluviimonas sp. D31]
MIPDYQSLMRPVLACAKIGPRKISEVVDEISQQLGLSAEEQNEMLPSGKQTIISNRVHWAKTYLKQAGLVKSDRRGWYELAPRGIEILDTPSIKLSTKFLETFQEFQDFKTRSRSSDDGGYVELSASDEDITPDESIQAAHAKLTAALGSNLLDNVRSATPVFFERMIVELLLAMGYGGTSEEAGRALGQSGDDGVDGVIDQDPLGVDQIYLQAKRYAAGNTVGPADIRDFYGALSIKKATKGIFVTTSSFTSSAMQTATALGSRIVLIDGGQLAKLMIRYNIGCRDKEVLHIKQLDESYFDEAEG